MRRPVAVDGHSADTVQASSLYHVTVLCRLVKGRLPGSRTQQPCRLRACAMTVHCADAMSVQEELPVGWTQQACKSLPHPADWCGAGRMTGTGALALQACKLYLSAVSLCRAGGMDGEEGSAREMNEAAGFEGPGSPRMSLTRHHMENSSRLNAAGIQTTPGSWGGIDTAAQAAAVPQGGSTEGGSAGLGEAGAVPQSGQAQDSRARELERANKRAGLAWLQVRLAGT